MEDSRVGNGEVSLGGDTQTRTHTRTYAAHTHTHKHSERHRQMHTKVCMYVCAYAHPKGGEAEYKKTEADGVQQD